MVSLVNTTDKAKSTKVSSLIMPVYVLLRRLGPVHIHLASSSDLQSPPYRERSIASAAGLMLIYQNISKVVFFQLANHPYLTKSVLINWIKEKIMSIWNFF
jgi:hypothetical protein